MSNYGGPPTYGSMPPAGPVGPPPPNYLVPAILTTIFCCLPFGVASIVFAAQVNTKWAQGDLAGAQESSRKARLFAIVSAVAFLGGLLLVVGLLAAGLAALPAGQS